MQPLARYVVSRLFFDSIASSTASHSSRAINRSSFRASACLRCKFHRQVRHFADLNKPSSPSRISEPADRSTDIPAETSSQAEPSTQPAEDASSDLPSASEHRRSAVTKRFSHLMDNLQGNIFIASQRINDLTGYSGIEALKGKITVLEHRARETQEAVRSSRLIYKTTVADRAATQREVTTLLARKDSWSPSDLERFTILYRMDHSNEQAVQEAATKLADAERDAEKVAGQLSSSILSRYHEEQIWSDKIRRMSTWGTWGLMGVNVLLFLVFQFGFEPWRRRRLVSGFEEKVREALEQEMGTTGRKYSSPVPLDGVTAAGIQDLEQETEEKKNDDPVVDKVVADTDGEPGLDNGNLEEQALAIAEDHVPTALMKLRRPETWKASVEDLFSERVVEMRKQDVTLIALEGAATGAAIVTVIVALLRRS